MAHPIVMGSYGIGIGRNVACIVEAHHDDKGIIWPAEVAPYAAHLVSIGAARDPQVTEVAERLHALAIGRVRTRSCATTATSPRGQVHRRRAAGDALDPDRQPAIAGGRRDRGHGAGDRENEARVDRGGRGVPGGSRFRARLTRARRPGGSDVRPPRPRRRPLRSPRGGRRCLARGDRARLARPAQAAPSRRRGRRHGRPRPREAD